MKNFKDYLDTEELKNIKPVAPKKKGFKDYLEEHEDKNLLTPGEELPIEDKLIFQVVEGAIQYKMLLDDTWNRLIEVEDLVGPRGDAGISGVSAKDINISIDADIVSWKYIDEDTLHPLISLHEVRKGSDTGQYIGVTGPLGPIGPQGEAGIAGPIGERGVIGPKGMQGKTGKSGKDGERGDKGVRGEKGETGLQGFKGEVGNQGVEGKIGVKGEIGERGEIGLQGLVGERGERGETGRVGVDGREVEIRNFRNQNVIEWKYVDEDEWTFLIDLKISMGVDGRYEEGVIVGPSGDRGIDGLAGLPGKDIEMQVAEGNLLQYRVIGAELWITLIDIDTLTPGGEGITIKDDGEFLGAGVSEINFLTDGEINVVGNVATITLGEEMKYTVLLDFDGDYIYKGEAVPGSSGVGETELIWRISRTYIDPVTEDIDIKWANGTILFDKQFSIHLTYSYS